MYLSKKKKVGEKDTVSSLSLSLILFLYLPELDKDREVVDHVEESPLPQPPQDRGVVCLRLTLDTLKLTTQTNQKPCYKSEHLWILNFTKHSNQKTCYKSIKTKS